MRFKPFKLAILSLIVIVIAMSGFPYEAVGQDAHIDRFRVMDQNYNFGRGSSDSDLGSSIGWNESVYMEGYMNMYDSTGSPFWLDKMVDQTDRVISNARDTNGDGYKGWPDSRYSHMQIKNGAFAFEGAPAASVEKAVYGSFELDSDSDGVPDGWSRQGNASAVYRSTTLGDAFAGSTGIVIESDGTNENRLVQPLTYTPGRSYQVEAYASVDTEQTEARVEIFNATTNTVLAFERVYHVGFERYVFTFKAPNIGNLQIRLGLENYAQAGYKARFDAISVKELDQAGSVEHNPLQNGGMETLNTLDATLPDKWVRFNSNSSNAYVSNDSHSGAHSLAITTDNTLWRIVEQTIDYIPSQPYTVTYWGKVSSTAASARILVSNATDNVTIGDGYISTTSWSQGSLTFTAPAVAGKTVKIRLYQSDWRPIGFTSYFDDVSITPALPPTELIANRGFDAVNSSDPTLPLNWTRTAGTTSSDAYLVDGINYNYSGAKGLAVRAAVYGDKSIEQAVSYTPGESYILTYWGRTTNALFPGEVSVYNETDGVELGSSSFAATTWSKQAIRFTAPPIAGKTIKVRVSQPASAGGTIGYTDLLSMSRLRLTEAAGWTRESTPLSAAHRTNDSTIFVDDDAGLELVHDGVSTPRISQNLWNYKPNAEYGMTFSGLVSAGASGEVRVYDRTTSQVLGSWNFNHTDKQQIVYCRFLTPSAGHNIVVEVSVSSGSPGDSIWVDTFAVGVFWEEQVHEAVLAAPVLRFVNAVYANPLLHSRYKAKADIYRDFIADELDHKWDSWWRQISGTDGSNNGTGVYLHPTGITTEVAPGRSLPHNQYLVFARMLYLLHDATEGVSKYAADRPMYWSRANDMERAFQSVLRAHPLNASLGTDAYLWNYWDRMVPGDMGHYAYYENEDISHAANTTIGPLEAFNHGQIYTQADMQKIANTFSGVMWNQSLIDPVVSAQNSRAPRVTADKLNTMFIHYWTDLAQIDPLVWDIANAVCERDTCKLNVAASLAKWNRNKTIHTGFEMADPLDATLPKSWNRWQSNSTTAYLSQVDTYSNSYSARVKTNGTTWQVLEQKLENYEPNTPYTISFMAKKYGSVDGRVQLFDYTTSTVLGQIFITETNWTRKVFTAVTPDSGHDVRIRLYHTNYQPAGQEIGFDNVLVFPELAAGELPNASFENFDSLDSTLPLYWQRGDLTVAGNVLIDATDRTAGHNSLKLVSTGTGVNQELLYMWKGYKPSGSYNISLKGKATGIAGGKVQIIDTSTNTVLAATTISASTWTASTVSFTAPAAHDHTLKVVITHNNPGAPGTLWVDEIMVSSD